MRSIPRILLVLCLVGVNLADCFADTKAKLLLIGKEPDHPVGTHMYLMGKGVGPVTIHWASSIHKENLERLGPRWLSYLGRTWVSNVGLHTGDSPLKQLQPDHPICRGWREYELK